MSQKRLYHPGGQARVALIFRNVTGTLLDSVPEALDKVNDNFDELYATRYDDMRMAATAINPPGLVGDPDFDTTLPGWLFDATTEEMLMLTVQLPHGYKEGTDLSPHVHWQKTTSAAGNVAWQLEYKWAPIGEVSDANWTTLVGATVAAGTPDTNTTNMHMITPLGTISGTGRQISDMLIMKLSRIPGDSPDLDTYAADARLLEFDIHYQTDFAGGSTSLYTK